MITGIDINMGLQGLLLRHGIIQIIILMRVKIDEFPIGQRDSQTPIFLPKNQREDKALGHITEEISE